MKSKKKSRMFDFIDSSYNPLCGKCIHGCIYCWSFSDKGLVKKYSMTKYSGDPRICDKTTVLNKKFKENEFVFMQDMSDLFAKNVPKNLIQLVLGIIVKNPQAKFLLLTKNPKRYSEFLGSMPENVTLGATIESDKEFKLVDHSATEIKFSGISKAPSFEERLEAMEALKYVHLPKFISVEPIIDFTDEFVDKIVKCDPWAVAVGYDNYNWRLPEPTLHKTLSLISELKKYTIVYTKTLRKGWFE